MANDDLNTEVQLTEEQKSKIIAFWNSRPNDPPSFRELIEEVLGKEIDSRSKLARLLKEFLATRQIVVRNSTNPKGDLELNESQKLFIRNSRKEPNKLRPVEIARELFPDKSISPLGQETRTVTNYVKTFEADIHDAEKIPEGDYEPPINGIRALARVKKYTKRDLDYDNLTPRQKKEIDALVTYLQNYRFVSQINLYDSQDDRDLFEANFIRFTYDKYDLSEEELEQYILLATDSVRLNGIQKTIKKLQIMLDTVTEDPDGKISIGLTEAINSAQDSYNECFGRQEKLLKNLVGTRAGKLAKQGDKRMSLVELIEFVQEENKRHLLAKLAEERSKRVKDEVNRVKNLDDLIIEIYGVTEEELA